MLAALYIQPDFIHIVIRRRTWSEGTGARSLRAVLDSRARETICRRGECVPSLVLATVVCDSQMAVTLSGSVWQSLAVVVLVSAAFWSSTHYNIALLTYLLTYFVIAVLQSIEPTPGCTGHRVNCTPRTPTSRTVRLKKVK